MGELETGSFPMSGGEMPSDEVIDNLLSGASSNRDEIPMFQDKPAQEPSEQNAQNAGEMAQNNQPEPKAEIPPGVDPVVHKFQQELAKLTPEQRTALMSQPVEVTHNGEKVQIAADKQVPLMQMGLNYAVKMHALNTERAAFDEEKKSFSDQQRYYGEIDKVAKENPQWWQHVQAEYQKFSGKAGNAGDGNPGGSGMTPVERELRAEIVGLKEQLSGYLNHQKQEAQSKQFQAEDAALDAEVAAFAKANPEFDWITADANGQTLEQRIYQHADKHGIQNYRAAARDYLHDEIVKRRELKAKETIGKDIQAKTRSGVVQTKGKPNGLKAPSNINKSYDELVREGLAELG